MKRLGALFLCFALFASLVGCGKKAGGESFGFVLSAEPKQIDPQAISDTASLAVISAAFEGLTALDENGKAVPAAADWTVSQDGCTYTFILRESFWSTVTVRGEKTGFEDPVMVTADDFVFAVRRTADPTTRSPYTAQLAGIRNAAAVLAGKASSTTLGVEAVDEKTLVFYLDAPDDNFTKRLASPAFMPCSREFFAYTAGRYGLETRYILTNGPFYVSGWEHDTSVTLRKNENYHAAAEVLPASVKYRISTDAAENYDLLRRAYIDAAEVPVSEQDTAEENGVRLVELQDTVRFLYFNTTDEVLANVDVRRALRDAVEWETLKAGVGAGCTAAVGYTAPAATAGGSAYTAPATACPLKTDVQKAQKALTAGLTALERSRTPSLTLLAPDDADSANLARYIVQSLTKNLSVYCSLELAAADEVQKRVRAGRYQLAICDVTAAGLTALENLAAFKSGNAQNYARFSSAAFDAAYDKATDSAAAVTTLEQLLYDASPALPLAYITRCYGVRAEDTGITVRPFNGGAFGALLSFKTADRKK